MNPSPDAPSRLLQISSSYWKTCALHAGAMLDVFTPLASGPGSAPALASSLGCDQRALEMLLNALAAMKLLEKSGDSYALVEESLRFLVKTSPEYIGYIIRHHHRLMDSWTRLPEAVRAGKPTRAHETTGEGREDFLLGMFNLASAIAPRLAKTIDLSGRKRLLDLGGGPGTYAANFCLANPGLSASVFDLSASETFARATVERLGVTDRVDFIAGDYLKDAVATGYDVAWLSQILHAEGPAGCRTILDKAAKALDTGGLIFVHEFMLDDAMDGPEFAALFSLNMLLGTTGGQSYSQAQLRKMLEDAGFRDVVRLDFTGPNDSAVLRAVKH